MSDKVGFKDKFCNKFNIGKVPRKPMREEVTSLRARALKLPQTNPEVKGVVVQLNDAKEIIFGKVKTNQERESSVQMTRNIVDRVKPELERLEKNKPVPVTYEVGGKKASKEDIQRAKDMLGLLTPLQQSVEEMFAPSQNAPAVLMPPNLGRLDLLGEIETVRLHISQGIVDEARAKELSKEIGSVQRRIREAKKAIDDSRDLIGTYDQQGVDADPTLQAVARQLETLARDPANGKVPLPADTPLALALFALRKAAHPEMGMINPAGLKAASDLAAKEVNAAKADPAAYAKKCCTGARQQNVAAQAVEKFDAILNGPLAQLYEHASAMGTTDHSAISAEVGIARSKIAASKSPVPPLLPMITDPLLEKINSAVERLKNDSEALRKRVTDAHTALTTTLDGIADTKGKKFFAADWVAIDALRNTIEGMIPVQNAPLNQDTLGALSAVEPLIAKLKTTAEAIHPSKSKAAEDIFDLAKAAIDKVMKSGDAPAATLKKYDPKKWAELEEGYGKIEKMVGVSRFAEVSKAIDDFKKTKFDAAVKAGKELAPVIAAATKAYDTYNNIYIVAQMTVAETGLPTPNTQDLALRAVKAELAKTPPDKAKLEQLKTALDAAFKDITTADDLSNATVASHKTEKDKAEKTQAETKGNREPLQNRYYALEMQFAEAKAMVKEAKGDPNAIKQIERLMTQAQSEINAVTAEKKTMDKPTATMTRIQQRIDLMIAHPEGEAIRRLTELPGLYNEFRHTRADAQGQLGGLMQLIGTYMAEQGNDKAVEDLLDRVTEYSVRFTMNGDDFASSIDALADGKRPEAERRKAREHVLAGIAELQRGITAHPISRLLAESPLAGAKGVPRRLMAILDRLNFTVLTSVES
jgi:hypothetical protein